MDETGEQKVKFIGDISEEFEHNVGNSLVPARVAIELSESGRAFDEEEDKEWLDELRGTKVQLLERLNQILQSEFNATVTLTKDSISQFRDIVERADFAKAEDIRLVINAFEQLKGPVDEEVMQSKEQMRQSL